jgi:predicted MFS family arabinose efflux permease
MASGSGRLTIALLAVCQGLLLTNNSIIVGLNGIVGESLASNKAMATLPLTAYVVGTAISTIPASLWMKSAGRRLGFITGAAIGCLGSCLCALAVARASFWLLCFATLLIGIYNAFGQYYRFAAAESVGEGLKGKAISLVLAGGIVGGFVGPESSKWTKDLLPVTYLGPYLFLAVMSVLAILVQCCVRLTPPYEATQDSGPERPILEILAQPAVLVAVLSALVGYGVMNFLMTATPIAMLMHHHHYNDAAFIIEWHIVGMFAPSFFTGSLIKRWGALSLIGAGGVLMLACIGIASSTLSLAGFWCALVLLGVAWNFLYIGGTALLTEGYRPAERAKTQGANDFLIFGTMAVTSLSSGVLLHGIGWQAMSYWMLPFVLAILGAATWLALGRRAGRSGTRIAE